MHEAVLSRADNVDVVVMAAAVADYTPADRLPQKMPKDAESLTLVMQRTPDILGDLGRRRLAKGDSPVLVGFAAETEDLIRRAAAKREKKHIDLIVANDVSRDDAGFDVDTNEVTIIGPEGADHIPLQGKAHIAAAILDRIELGSLVLQLPVHELRAPVRDPGADEVGPAGRHSLQAVRRRPVRECEREHLRGEQERVLEDDGDLHPGG